ncbi:MAG TPA: NfeD family protein [Candidatus Thermoplasmatota archaeon]|nr:NfeD family protein [Candidatus Thermoplasmatota archaeon]
MVELSLGTVSTIFLVLGIVLLLIEAMSPGFFVAIPGTVLIILGVFALVVDDQAVFTFWAPIIALGTAIPTTAITVWAYRRIAPANGPPTTMSADALVGKRGQVTTEVVPASMSGKVKVESQVWSATSDRSIPIGVEVVVTDVKGVTLTVEPSSEGAGAP